MRPLKAWSASAFTALLILGVSLGGLTRSRPNLEVRTRPLITHMGGLTTKSPPGQLFRCEQDGLHQIDVRLVSPQKGLVTLRLRAGSPTSEVIREVSNSPEVDPTGHAWSSFRFPTIADSRGSTFHFSLSPSDEAATKISPWVRFHGQVGVNSPWGDRFLKARALHQGDTLSAHANLRAMAFPVESFSPALGSARLALFDNSTSEEPIRISTLEAHDEVSSGWVFFPFEPLPDSRWRRYHYELQVPDSCQLIGTEDDGGAEVLVYKTFHGLELSDSPLLGMTRGSARQPDRDLVFRTWCEDPAEEVIARLNERTGGVLWLAALLWAVATTICLRVFVFLTPDSSAFEGSTSSQAI
jgi:hypothetical protein